MPIGELKTRLPAKRLRLVEEYRDELEKLPADQGGRLVLEKGDDPKDLRRALKAAAGSLNRRIRFPFLGENGWLSFHLDARVRDRVGPRLRSGGEGARGRPPRRGVALRPAGDRATASPGPHTDGRTICWARLYAVGTTLLYFGRASALRRRTVELAGIGLGERIRDVGCGPGRLAILAGSIAGPAGEVCGVDPAAEMVGLARRNAARAGVSVRFDVGVIEGAAVP